MSRLTLMIFFLGLFSFSLAQSTFSGTVLDNDGFPLEGVNVTNQQNQETTLSDIEGKFSISGEIGNVLKFELNNSVLQEFTIKNEDPISIEIASTTVQMEQLVVVGYGKQKKSDVTGAIGSLNNEDFNQGLIANAGQLLQGKVAGVNVSNVSGEPGASQDIIIRGVSSMRSGTTPLYVIDGFPIDNTSNGTPTNPMNFINPQDIESIDVLKDASAAAIYGARAANGVIVITTKKGKKGKVQMNFSSSLTISNIANKLDVFSADEFRNQVTGIGAEIDDMGGNTDWQDELTKTATSSNINFSVAGGTDNGTYFGAIGYDDQEGIFENSNLQRYSGRVNLSQKGFNDRFQIDFNLTGTRTENNRANVSTMVGDMLTLNPTYPAYTNGEPTTEFNNGAFNPLIRSEIYSDLTTNNRILGNVSPSFEFLKGLTYKLNLGADYSSTERTVQNRPHDIPFEEGNLNLYYTNNKNTLVENTLTYQTTIGKHDFTIMAGHSYQDIRYEARGWNYRVFPNNGIEPAYQIESAGELVSNYSEANKNELQSWFGRFNYGYADKYLLTVTIRADGSSKFGENNRYGYFPSVAAGWNISKENFLSNSTTINNLKLRGSWGQTGNQEIPSKITKVSYQSSNLGNATYPLDDTGNYPVGVFLVRTANPDLQWEVTTQTNIGLDFGLFGNRLSGTFDFFHKVTDNILLEINPTDPITPTSKLWKNIPDMTINNTGFEIGLNYDSNPNREFTYGVSANAAFIKNEVKDSPYSVLTTGEAQGAGTTNATINGYINGEPIGSFYIRDFMGIGEDGTNIFRDLNGDGVINDYDRFAAGSALPDFTYNFSFKFGYKNFDLGLNFNGVSGNMIFNNTASTYFSRGQLSLSHNTTDAAVEYPNESSNNTNVISNRYLEKGDYLRLNNATLGYNLRPELVGLDGLVSNIRFSITGQNLFVITKYSGFDPEVNTGLTTDGIQTFGIDYLTYPKTRSFVFGVNVSF